MKDPQDQPDDPLARCMACEKLFKIGDPYLPDISGGEIHFACLGPEPECYVDLDTGERLGRIPEPLLWDDFAFRGWTPVDVTALPDTRNGPFLATNRIEARNAHGLPSHVWLVEMFHADGGQVSAFDAGNRKVLGISHFRAVFPPLYETAEGRPEDATQ